MKTNFDFDFEKILKKDLVKKLVFDLNYPAVSQHVNVYFFAFASHLWSFYLKIDNVENLHKGKVNEIFFSFSTF